MGPSPLDDFEFLRTLLVRRYRTWASHDAIEDAVQEAMLALWMARNRGETILVPSLFASTVARRQILAGKRRGRLLEAIRTDPPAVDCVSELPDWAALLSMSGYAPSDGRARLLALLAQGVRTNKGLARLLSRDVATIKESRARLQRWLRDVCMALGIPPPSEHFVSSTWPSSSDEGKSRVRNKETTCSDPTWLPASWDSS